LAERTRSLHETLVELQQQLASTDVSNPALREELRAAMEEIRAKVEAGEEAEPGVVDRLRELMLRFEASYPSVAEAVGAVASALARIGI
jgi:hypothetical protein